MANPPPSGSRKRTISQTEPIMDDPLPLKCTPKLETAADDIDDGDGDEEVVHLLSKGTRPPDPLLLLSAIIATSHGKLISAYMNPVQGKVLLEQHPGLKDALEESWESKSFRSIRNLKILRPKQVVHPLDFFSLVPTTPGQELEYFRRAFEMKYISPFPTILLTTMDRYMVDGSDYYNRSFSIVQSSGMGKSRLVDFSAQSRFTFPFKLHEQMEPGYYTYPPCDNQVRDYLTQTFSDEDHGMTRHVVFLEALFTSALTQLETYQSGSPKDVARTWYDWLKHGTTFSSVGTNRISFYDAVVKAAKRLERSTPSELGIQIVGPYSDSKYLLARKERLIGAAKRFTRRLAELHGDISGKVAAIVYFDEAHTLQKRSSNGTLMRSSPYFALMSVLNKLANLPIFFIFLSTNPSLQPRDADYPSLRVQQKLIPPFFELPYDVFCHGFTQDLQRDGKLTLNGVCEIGQMARFGRPMWYSHYVNVKGSGLDDPLILFAEMKLWSQCFESNQDAQLAALDCRILIPFDPLHPNACKMQAEFVRMNMRTIFNIPTGRDCMSSGYPSEPVLAEAAARLLNRTSIGITRLAPQILKHALNKDFIAREGRRELVARTLFTVTHDLAILQQYPQVAVRRFHYPVRLLTFLEQLLAPDIWRVVRKARPFHAYPGDPTLETAFKDAWLNFSHFTQLGDHSSFSLGCAAELLKRGVAIQAYDNQYGVDGALPILFGDPSKTTIDISHTSLVQYQVKNAATPIHVSPAPDIAGRNEADLPIISIVMQLGVELDPGKRVVVQTEKGADGPAGRTRSSVKSQPTDIERRHYLITVYGCTSNTYRVVPEASTEYRHILQPAKPFPDFPRAGLHENEEAVMALKPMIFDKGGVYMPWCD